MMNVRCEDFEREYQNLSNDNVSVERKRELEVHLQSCKYCMNYSKATGEMREALLHLPNIDVPPYFETNLKREINRLEHGLRKPELNSKPLPRFLAFGSGFAVALLISFLVFQGGQYQQVMPGLNQQPGSIAKSEQPSATSEQIEEQLHHDDIYGTLLLTESGALYDTSTHRLPEPAGTDSIPIPVDDDFWQINQVSTTPDEN
jgi:hypothetical protein